ncbi:hypothetical protein AUJ64_01265 [Candidatus Pacearchaeota archaeon CG1_02_39_14]|nr:MAG: hypothetical protein AUJ64_01265 [Candidatus Pacearchaeota archaeon CG1_02_39_14]
MKYSEFVELYEKLAGTTKKLEKVGILANFLKELKKRGKSEWIYLLRGRVVADYDEREFGISGKLTIKAISRVSGVSDSRVVSEYRKIGDLGEIAEKLLGQKSQSTLFSACLKTEKVFDNLRKIMGLQGKGSVDKKLGLIAELLGSASGKEAKYIIRTLLNDLRVGVADAILRDAISKTFFDGEEMEADVEEAYDRTNDFAEVFELAGKGKTKLKSTEIRPGRPIKVMLPVKVTEIDEALRICGEKVAVEHKYDGFRVVISYDGKNVMLFTRKLDNVTNQFPDIVNVVKSHVKGKSFILDTEVVGYDPKTKKYMPFEAISQRIKRKHDIEKLVKELPVEINVFDVLYHNGNTVMDIPFIKRRKLLEKIIKAEHFKIRPATQIISEDKKKIDEFYKEALRTGEEGVMIKSLDAIYRPGRRVGFIVKMKPVVADLDLVIVGAEYGTGKRAGGLTSFYVACKDKENGFLEVGRVSSGLKEKEGEGVTYKEMDKILRPLITKTSGRKVFIKPKVVVSVTYQNIQKSPGYSSGYALRFPRIMHYRPERGVYDIASLDEIKKDAERK